MHRYEGRSGGLVIGALLLAVTVAACGGERADTDTTMMDTSQVAPAPTGGAVGGDAAMIALGDSIFKGQAGGGICYTCHGLDGKGTTLAPDLTDAQWINADGSLESIINVVQNGVAQPKQFPAAMPPMGGAQLSTEQVRAVSMYVRSLSAR